MPRIQPIETGSIKGVHGKSQALDVIHAAVAIVYVFVYLILSRVFLFCVAPGVLIWRKAGAVALIRRFPYVGLVVGQVAVLLLAYNTNDKDFFSAWMVLVALSFVVALALVQMSAAEIVRPPKSIEDIVPENALERWFSDRLRVKVDVYFVRIVWQNTLITLPAFLALVSSSLFGLSTIIMYVMAVLVCASIQQNLVHTDCHNHLFRWRHLQQPRERLFFRIFDFYAKYILTIMQARIPLHYAVEHLVIHHVEDNGVDDVQTTVFYDRASFIDFCKAALREGESGASAVLIYSYLLRRGLLKSCRQLTKGMAVWFAVLAMICLSCPEGALIILSIRFLAGVPTAASMFMWHGFVDLDRLGNCFATTTNIVPMQTLGVQFMHADHHAHPGQHWTCQYKNIDAESGIYSKEETINFRPMNNLNFMIVKALWRERYDLLAKWYVPLGGGFEDRSVLADVMRQRTRPLVGVERGRIYRSIDRMLGWLAADYLTPGRLPK